MLGQRSISQLLDGEDAADKAGKIFPFLLLTCVLGGGACWLTLVVSPQGVGVGGTLISGVGRAQQEGEDEMQDEYSRMQRTYSASADTSGLGTIGEQHAAEGEEGDARQGWENVKDAGQPVGGQEDGPGSRSQPKVKAPPEEGRYRPAKERDSRHFVLGLRARAAIHRASKVSGATKEEEESTLESMMEVFSLIDEHEAGSSL